MSTGRCLTTMLYSVILVGGLLSSNVRAQKVKDAKPGMSYTSPLKNFTVIAPDLCMGTKMLEQHDKTSGTVAFFSDVGQLDRIDFDRLNENISDTIALADSALRSALYFEHLNSTILQPNEAKLLLVESHEFDQREALFALVEIPGGSVSTEVTFEQGKATSKRKDSVRGLMVFADGMFLYILHHEVGIDLEEIWPCSRAWRNEPPAPPQEPVQTAREGLHEFYSMISFK